MTYRPALTILTAVQLIVQFSLSESALPTAIRYQVVGRQFMTLLIGLADSVHELVTGVQSKLAVFRAAFFVWITEDSI